MNPCKSVCKSCWLWRRRVAHHFLLPIWTVYFSFVGTGWWFPTRLRVRRNLNSKKAILCSFIKNAKMAGSKARYKEMGRPAFSRGALWKTSEETPRRERTTSYHMTKEHTTQWAHLWTSRSSRAEQRMGTWLQSPGLVTPAGRVRAAPAGAPPLWVLMCKACLVLSDELYRAMSFFFF